MPCCQQGCTALTEMGEGWMDGWMKRIMQKSPRTVLMNEVREAAVGRSLSVSALTSVLKVKTLMKELLVEHHLYRCQRRAACWLCGASLLI